MDFSTLAATRYSCRSYDESRCIEQEKLDAILEAAQLSPSACNGQPSPLTVCRGDTAKAVAAACTGMGFLFSTVGLAITKELVSQMGGYFETSELNNYSPYRSAF